MFKTGETKQFIETFMNNYNAEHGLKYDLVESDSVAGEFQILQYINSPSFKPPSWLRISREAAKSNQLQEVKNKNYALLMFFFSYTEIFVITGGHSYRIIEEIVDYDFGFSIVERLIDPNKTEIRSLSERGFVGIELASSRFFRSDFVFHDNDDFGKFYRGLEAFIDEKALSRLGVQTERKKLLVKGEAGFKIDTSINLETILNRISRLSKLLKVEVEPGFEINPFRNVRYKELSSFVVEPEKFRDRELESVLNEMLFKQYYNDLNSPKLDTEIFHPSLIEYLNSSVIYLQRGRERFNVNTNQKIYLKTLLRPFNVDTSSIRFDTFVEWITRMRTIIKNEDVGTEISDRKLSEWLSGEVEFNNTRYIKFENIWYTYSSNFVSNLNSRLDSMFERIDLIELPDWKSDESDYEEDYNRSLLSKFDSGIMGDTIKYRNIELADFISSNETEMIIYHVKNGLDRNLRVLQSQILNSAKVISEVRISDFEQPAIKNYFERVIKFSERNGGRRIGFDEFKNNYLKKDSLRFVFAYATKKKTTGKHEILEEIKSTKSSIAKISILHTYYTLKAKDIRMSISKIYRE